MKNIVDAINYLAIEVLEYMGNKSPTEEQIQLMEEFLSTTYIKKKIVMNERLSSREKSCLLLAAYGKSTQEIGMILNIKPNTVATYRKEIIRKLGCKNITHAVFHAIKYENLNHLA